MQKYCITLNNLSNETKALKVTECVSFFLLASVCLMMEALVGLISFVGRIF